MWVFIAALRRTPPKPSLSWPVACPSSEMAVVMVRGSREISIWFHFIITSLIWKHTKTTNFNYPAWWGGGYIQAPRWNFLRISILTNDQQTLHFQPLVLTCRMSCERRAWQHRFGNALILRGLFLRCQTSWHCMANMHVKTAIHVIKLQHLLWEINPKIQAFLGGLGW